MRSMLTATPEQFASGCITISLTDLNFLRKFDTGTEDLCCEQEIRGRYLSALRTVGTCPKRNNVKTRKIGKKKIQRKERRKEKKDGPVMVSDTLCPAIHILGT